ncbi:hypothetical protein HAX54_045449, partial [Datura stramonium]|nr:hypothetical protein [Datura stramonium]
MVEILGIEHINESKDEWTKQSRPRQGGLHVITARFRYGLRNADCLLCIGLSDVPISE